MIMESNLEAIREEETKSFIEEEEELLPGIRGKLWKIITNFDTLKETVVEKFNQRVREGDRIDHLVEPTELESGEDLYEYLRKQSFG
jgi:Txe/YoeB family toxin of Txe-Axe toxin-antitoxin module